MGSYNTHALLLNVDSSGGLYFYSSSDAGTAGWDVFGAWRPAANIDTGWNHIAWTRHGNTTTVFINGTGYSRAMTQTLLSGRAGGEGLLIGRQTGPAYYNGYIDEFRISKGIARWTENFSVPTSTYSGPGEETVPEPSNMILFIFALLVIIKFQK